MIHIKEWENKIFNASPFNFDALAVELFHFQYEENEVYHQYIDTINTDITKIRRATDIPFLPIQFFKTHKITSTVFEPEVIFESSGTTGSINSRHYIRSLQLYRDNFSTIFELFYGNHKNICILGLLPSYLERKNASLVYMVDELIRKSPNKLSGFYLKDLEKLHQTLLHNEIIGQKTLLIGVTFALLDFAEQFPMKLKNTFVMETGGMKGRRQEMIRSEVQDILKKQLGVKNVHSEYGMTELLSQAYAKKDGKFKCPPWMKAFVRKNDDPKLVYEKPLANKLPVSGVLNIIDLANLYSCGFIATEDIGILHPDGCFEVQGRVDNSDIRGCSLMTLSE